MTTTILNKPISKRQYQLAMAIFVALFFGSVVLSLVDIDASYAEYRNLHFPTWSVHALSAAKVLGLIAILTNRFPTLSDFAFAGFLYDLLLALIAHAVAQEIKVLVPFASLGIWAFAFVAHRRSHRGSTAAPVRAVGSLVQS
jgi:hypothetical protein